MAKKKQRKKITKKQTEAHKAFSELIGLYEVADTMEDNDWDLGAKHVRAIADKVGKFILNQK
jgi:hypothetical protein